MQPVASVGYATGAGGVAKEAIAGGLAKLSASAKDLTKEASTATVSAAVSAKKTLTSKDWLKNAVDVTAPVEIAWVTHDGAGSGGELWVRMHEGDERRLNAALAERIRVVAVRGGRWEAEISSAVDGGNQWAGAISARYYEEHPRQLARTIWCYRAWPTGQWTPFAATDDAALEQTLQGMGTPVGGTLPDEAGFVTVDGLYRITLKQQPNGTIIPLMSAVNKRWLSLGTTYTVSRGWAGEALERLTPEEAAAEESEPKALVLVVHGIGETFFANRHMSGIKTLKEGVDKMRTLGATSSH